MNIGDKFGRLTVLELVPDRKNPAAICLCECGNKTKTKRGALRNGKAKSCGCLRTEKFIEMAKAARIYSDEERKKRKSKAQVVWQQNNREKYRERHSLWSSKNKDKIRSYSQKRKYEKSLYDKEYRLRNIDRLREIRLVNSHKRRIKMKCQIGIVDKDIKKKLMILQKGKCAACRCKLENNGCELDHIVPIAKGGMHDNKNLQLLCGPCNRSKGAKEPEVFMQQKGFLL